MPTLADKAAQNLLTLRQSRPLVHNITNFVTMNAVANALLACGASPVMAHATSEVEEMVVHADALVLNIGTLNNIWVEAMLMAGRQATRLGKPIVLDPVGSGATELRTQAALTILRETGVTVVRGNASEVLSLAGGEAATKGVDAGNTMEDAARVAEKLALTLGVTLAVTGPIDLVTDGRRTVFIEGGHALMPRVTGTGCTASALVGAFLAIDADPVLASVSALALLGLAGERAGAKAHGPGSLQMHLLDELYAITPHELMDCSRLQEGSRG